MTEISENVLIVSEFQGILAHAQTKVDARQCRIMSVGKRKMLDLKRNYSCCKLLAIAHVQLIGKAPQACTFTTYNYIMYSMPLELNSA